MPIIKSAKKRVRVTKKATVRNVKTKRSMKEAVKAFAASITSGKNVNKAHSQAQSEIDHAAKMGVMHKNKAARKKSQLAKMAKAASAAPAPKKTPKKATVAKKPTAKKPSPKKASAKK